MGRLVVACAVWIVRVWSPSLLVKTRVPSNAIQRGDLPVAKDAVTAPSGATVATRLSTGSATKTSLSPSVAMACPAAWGMVRTTDGGLDWAAAASAPAHRAE